MNYTGIYRALFDAYRALPYALGGGRAFAPLHVFLETTYRCNVRCDFCQFFEFEDRAARAPSAGELTLAEIDSVLDEVPSWSVVSLTGGELFVRRDVMEILGHAARRHAVTFISNGTLIDDDRARELVELAPRGRLGRRGLVLADVSLQAAGEANDRILRRRGAFERSRGALEALARHRAATGRRWPLLGVKTVLTGRSLPGLVDLYRFACEVGVDVFNLMVYSGIDVHAQRMTGRRHAVPDRVPELGERLDLALLRRQLEEIDQLRRAGGAHVRLTPPDMPWREVFRYYGEGIDHRDYRCTAPWSTVGVSAYGEVSACPYFSQGNLRERGFRAIWNGPEMRALRRSIRAHGSFPGCVGCCNLRHVDGTGGGLDGLPPHRRSATS